jgi:hypothetical protein
MLQLAKRYGFAPGGMNLALTRSFYLRSGGFPAWAGSADDVLMGMRAKHLGARIVPVPTAVVWYHMGRSTGETWRRLRNYARWNAKLGIQLGAYRTLLTVMSLALVLLIAGAWVWQAAVAGVVLALCWPLVIGMRRQLRLHVALRRMPRLQDLFWAVWLAAVCDLAVLRGLAGGLIDRLRDPTWPMRTRQWIQAAATAI